MYVPKILETVSKALQKMGVSAIVVGGSVRDHFLDLPIKDYDIEVYGLKTLDDLETLLSQYGTVNLVGKSFGILKFVYEGDEYDFSFPRTETKVGVGHKGFEVHCDGTLSFKAAALRRDFTVNAIGYEIEKKEFIDPYNGQEDIKKRCLRLIKRETFVEDPLRVYRAMQFAARFEFTLDEVTFELCKSMVKDGHLDELPKERVYEEFKKLLLKSKKPSIGFEMMRQLGIIEKYYPELYALIGVPQNPKWHPEGDVWTHTMMALDQMVHLKTNDSKYDLKMMFAILCHDLGKATHTQITEEKITAIGHELAGIELTQEFMYRLMDEHDFIKGLFPLIEHHLAPSIYYRSKAKDKTIRRLSTKVKLEELVRVARADFLGRTTKASLSGIYEAGDWLLAKAKELNVEKRAPIALIGGKDLIALGLEPSKEFKMLLGKCYEAQLEDKIFTKDEATDYILKLIKN
ncbi:MAG TPA: HD domain-containing protein [Campylobacterales bacterium]|nr:HD domain-containing protein [Campylobacterales bacterium]HHS92086.1 HD domain-containing protein [Campylobacterales bacterium]